MLFRHTTRNCFLVVVACAALCFAGCGNSCFVGYSINGNGGVIVKGGNPPPTCSLNQAQGMVRAAMVKTAACNNCAPVATVQHMYVVLRSIQIHRGDDNSDSAWVDLAPGLASNPLHLDLIGDSLQPLADAPAFVPAGTYDSVKLQFAADSTSEQTADDSAQTRCGAGLANCLLTGDGQIESLRFSMEAATELVLPLDQQNNSLLVLPQSKLELGIHLGARPIERSLDSASYRPQLLVIGEVVARKAADPD